MKDGKKAGVGAAIPLKELATVAAVAIVGIPVARKIMGSISGTTYRSHTPSVGRPNVDPAKGRPS